MIEAVTFDYWNTLVREEAGSSRDHRLDAWMGILEDEGFAVERELLGAAFESSWQRFLEVWQENEAQYTAAEAAAQIVEELGYSLPRDVHERLVETFSTAGSVAKRHLTLHVRECLVELKAAGVRLGIICDVGMTPSVALRGFLESEGVLSLFDHWSFSDEVGAYKPSPVIFEHALAGLGGVAPDRAAHVGDLKRTDVAGARAFGMTSVRYTGVFDDAESEGDEADLVVADHSLLAKELGAS